jgi:hypothetical protein
MEFNTSAIWGIIIFLVLITIFIVIWYSYKEIIYCKGKIEEMLNKPVPTEFFNEPHDAYDEEEDGEYDDNDEDYEFSNTFFEEPIQPEEPVLEMCPIEAQPMAVIEELEPQDTPLVEEEKPKKKTRKGKKIVIEENEQA